MQVVVQKVALGLKKNAFYEDVVKLKAILVVKNGSIIAI
jgi:hypothetical protein